jgi:ABC-type lipoprotein export system ATPase subunit/GNAT superfamily N-acetyltransferase
VTLRLSPYVYLRKGDKLEFTPNLAKPVMIRKKFVDKATGQVTRVIVFPPYQEQELIRVPPHAITVTFKERTSPVEWRAAKVLERFHYRGKGFNRLVGRRIVMLAVSEQFGVLAYGVLSATVAMAKPRFELFRTNFTDQMRSGLINQIARVPRIVVHPEFRGMGLGVLMARHLVRYARRHWDINGYRPIMVEVIAKMTEYHRFFERAGFIALGQTEGYEDGIKPQYGNGSWGERKHEHFDFMTKQQSKPYLAWPLAPQVRRRIATVVAAMPPFVEAPRTPPKSAPRIRLTNVTASFRSQNGHSPRSALVQDAFGIDASQLQSTVVKELSLTIEPGDVVLVTGASGSGKSSLLHLMSGQSRPAKHRMHFSGRVVGVDPRRTAILTTDLPGDRSLVELVRQGKDIRDAIDLLNSVGLAEANLYVKRPNQLSDGQRYRFAVARLCDSGRPIWVADEFAASLNPELGATVAKGLRRLARKHGATVVLAAAHIDGFVDSLVPNKLIRLKWGGEWSEHSLKTVCRESERRLELRVTNTSATDLHNVSLRALDNKGQLQLLRTRRVLESGAEWCSILAKSSIRGAVAIRTLAQEKVGDLVYLRTSR